MRRAARGAPVRSATMAAAAIQALTLIATAGWQSAQTAHFFDAATCATSEEKLVLAALPDWAASEALPRLRFARKILCADDFALQSLIDDCPHFWSVPLHKTLLPRHAFLAMHTELRHGSELHSNDLDRLLLQPKSDAQFADALCKASRRTDHAAMCDDFTTFARSFRKGGLEAARTGDVAMLRALRSHGWCAALARDRNGASALHHAAGHGHADCCEQLVHFHGLNIDDRATDGATPLHWAVCGVRTRRSGGGAHCIDDSSSAGFGTGGHPSTASWLVRHGARVDATTHAANSVLHWCAWAGQLPLMRWLAGQLRESPQSMHALNSKGCSAAHWAASGGDVGVCRLLAEEFGVDFSRPNHEGNTPLTKAIEHGREGVVRWLLSSGRCEAAVAEAAGYAARLAVRHRATDVTDRIAECLQAYLLAQHHLRQQRSLGEADVAGADATHPTAIDEPSRHDASRDHAGYGLPLKAVSPLLHAPPPSARGSLRGHNPRMAVVRMAEARVAAPRMAVSQRKQARPAAVTTVCTGNRCYRNGAMTLLAACREITPSRSVGCSGVCPPNAVSVNEGPESAGPPLALVARDASEAKVSASTALAAAQLQSDGV